ncbi:hypothetical protein C8Q77DRAFT_1033883, partial [Trametes polyzona]
MDTPTVSPLFNRDDADVIFRSSDRVVFRLHKRVLTLASPFFEDMFALPDGPVQATAPQTVDVPESAAVLEDLFQFLYPMKPPRVVPDLDHLWTLLKAAQKYLLDFLTERLKDEIRSILPLEPLRIYLLAYLARDVDLARAAARHLLGDPNFFMPTDLPPEYEEVPATALWHVGWYRKRCTEAAVGVFRVTTYVVTGTLSRKVNAPGAKSTSHWWTWLECESCPKADTDVLLSGALPGGPDMMYPARAWWQTHIDTVKARLRSQPGPCGASVPEEELVRTTISAAASCITCGPRAALELYDFAEAMAKEVDLAVSEV